jgi:hypothetical protein
MSCHHQACTSAARTHGRAAGELRGACWEEIEGLDDLQPLWRVPAARMKGEKARKANGAGGREGGFTFHCVHNACSGRDRLDYAV